MSVNLFVLKASGNLLARLLVGGSIGSKAILKALSSIDGMILPKSEQGTSRQGFVLT